MVPDTQPALRQRSPQASASTASALARRGWASAKRRRVRAARPEPRHRHGVLLAQPLSRPLASSAEAVRPHDAGHPEALGADLGLRRPSPSTATCSGGSTATPPWSTGTSLTIPSHSKRWQPTRMSHQTTRPPDESDRELGLHVADAQRGHELPTERLEHGLGSVVGVAHRCARSGDVRVVLHARQLRLEVRERDAERRVRSRPPPTRGGGRATARCRWLSVRTTSSRGLRPAPRTAATGRGGGSARCSCDCRVGPSRVRWLPGAGGSRVSIREDACSGVMAQSRGALGREHGSPVLEQPSAPRVERLELGPLAVDGPVRTTAHGPIRSSECLDLALGVAGLQCLPAREHSALGSGDCDKCWSHGVRLR